MSNMVEGLKNDINKIFGAKLLQQSLSVCVALCINLSNKTLFTFVKN